MSPPPTATAPDTWQDLERRLLRSSRRLTVVVGRYGPVVTLDVCGRRLRVTDPRDHLGEQDGRRLVGLGLQEGDGADCWTWSAAPRGRGTAGASDQACRRQLVAVLRDGLRLHPAQLTVLPVDGATPP